MVCFPRSLSTTLNASSRFFEEIPPGLLKWLKPPQTKSYGGGYSAPAYHNAAPRPMEGAEGLPNLRIGAQVMHAKFGQGVVIGADGSGNDTRVHVNFGAAGMKILLLSVAKLEVL